MANAVKITAIGVNGIPRESFEIVVPVFGTRVITGSAQVDGSNSTFIVANVQGAGGGGVNYQTALTIDQALSLINTDAVTDLSNVGEFSTTGFATLGAGVLVERASAVAVNTSATVTAANVKTGYFTSTSAGAVTLTLPTATAVATELGAGAGSTYEFVVNNAAGASTVTVAVGSGIVTQSVLTGGETLTIAASATEGIGVFKLTFISATAAILSRIA